MARVAADGVEQAVDGVRGAFEDLEETALDVQQHAGDPEPGVVGARPAQQRSQFLPAEGARRRTAVNQMDQVGHLSLRFTVALDRL